MANNNHLVDVREAKAFIDANWPNDPLLKRIVVNLLDKLPRADAAPVDPGKWEEWWPGDCALIMTGEEKLFRCSACTAKYPDVAGFNYCPFCGKPMEPFTIF